MINKPIDEVWKTVALEFDKADNWMNNVPESKKKTTGKLAPNAPMIGRVCKLSIEPNGPLAEETIIADDESSKNFTVEEIPKNVSYPIVKNTLHI